MKIQLEASKLRSVQIRSARVTPVKRLWLVNKCYISSIWSFALLAGSVADPDPKSWILCLFDPRIRDRLKTQVPDPEWIFRIIFPRAKKQFFGLKILLFDTGSGMEKIRIRDKHPGSATMLLRRFVPTMPRQGSSPTDPKSRKCKIQLGLSQKVFITWESSGIFFIQQKFSPANRKKASLTHATVYTR